MTTSSSYLNISAGKTGFRRAFSPKTLTLGFLLPLEGYPFTAVPTMVDHAQLTRLADDLGFAALWARDVPTHDPAFGDVGQIFDPFTYLAFLAANTHRIALGTGSAVITLRHPIHLAKQAASVDVLSGGRLLLGVASGDRPVEYPAFGIEADYETRGERFREAFEMFQLAVHQSFPAGEFPRFGNLSGQVDTIPKPVSGHIPAFVTGRSRQSIEWTAQHADGWFYYYVDLAHVEIMIGNWRKAVAECCGEQAFKPYLHGLFFDLSVDPNQPLRGIHAGLSGGRNALIAYLHQLHALGVNHVVFNMKPSRRPVSDVLHEMAEYVLPHFPSLDETIVAP